jgi:hypothetical protein
MAIINVTFNHQTDGSFVEAKVDTSWSADFAISELIRKGFTKALSDAANVYHLVRKVNDFEFSGNTTFAEVGVEDGEAITIVARGKAG